MEQIIVTNVWLVQRTHTELADLLCFPSFGQWKTIITSVCSVVVQLQQELCAVLGLIIEEGCSGTGMHPEESSQAGERAGRCVLWATAKDCLELIFFGRLRHNLSALYSFSRGHWGREMLISLVPSDRAHRNWSKLHQGEIQTGHGQVFLYWEGG